MKKYLFLIILFIPFTVLAETAKNISLNAKYYDNDRELIMLNDNSYDSYTTISKGNTLTIKSEKDIKHIYIIYEIISSKGKLKTEKESIELGVNGFIHEYQKLSAPVNTLKLSYNNDVTISEIQVYSEGEIPDDVQIWKKEKTTDLMIFSTHADDEVLFFAGIIPTYIDRGKKIHVTYLARHELGKHKNQIRMHEQLDGLWTLGITDYPTFGYIPDAYSKIKENTPKEKEKVLKTVEKQLEEVNITDEDIINFDIKVMRQYKPKVIVMHDEYGEYGHGQHILNTLLLKEAIKKVDTNDYKLSKAYIHLYDKDNWTILDLDKPLDYYEGKTAYQKCKEAFLKHVTQQFSKYPAWLNGKNNEYTSAKDIKSYSPMYWGLYYTSVGKDKKKNDLFENISEEKKEVKTTKTTTTVNTTETTTKKEETSEIINEDINYKYILGLSGLLILLVILLILFLNI